MVYLYLVALLLTVSCAVYVPPLSDFEERMKEMKEEVRTE